MPGGSSAPELNIEQYAIAMENSTWEGFPVWAGQPEILAISQIYGVQLQIWDQNTGVLSPHGVSSQHAPITLAYVNNNHYNVLTPSNDPINGGESDDGVEIEEESPAASEEVMEVVEPRKCNHSLLAAAHSTRAGPGLSEFMNKLPQTNWDCTQVFGFLI